MKRSFAAALFMSTAAISLSAQVNSAQLSGTVQDATGAVVSGAKVTVHNDATGFERTAMSNSAGAYNFTALPIGTYKVIVTFAGFGDYNTSVTLNVGSNATIDAKLGATAAQAVTVTMGDEATQVNLTTQESSTIITSQQLQNLPSLSRNPYDFVVLSAGVTQDPGGSTIRGVGASLNGGRATSTEILLDGVENANSYGAGVGQTIPLDSVSEYRVITNGFEAQYGRASGGIVNLASNSGSNRFHGSAYEYNRVSALAANTYNEDAVNAANRAAGFANNPRDHFTRNQFGFSVGGPVLRDKLFFFSNYEWNRIRSTGSQEFEIPTASYLATTSASVQSFFKTYGATLAPGTILGPTVPVTGFASDPLQQVAVNTSIDAGAGSPLNAYFGDSRVDYNLNNKISMFVRVATYHDAYLPGFTSLSPYNGYNASETDTDQSYLYNLNYVVTPTIVTSSKLSYTRILTQQPINGTPSPTLYLTSGGTIDPATGVSVALPGYLPLSPGNALPFGGPQNTYSFIEDVTWVKGKHTIKAGGEFIQIRDNRTFGAFENAVEQVNKNASTGIANELNVMATGALYEFETAINPQGKFPCAYAATGATPAVTSACSINLPATQPSFERQNTFNDGSWYVQDSWKVTPRLTVNGGVRWEYYGVQHNNNRALESNFYLGTGSNLAQQVATGSVLTTPNSPTHGLISKQLKNYAPRVGFALDPFGNGKWAIRGGYGISYERNFGNVTYNVIQNPPNYAVVQYLTTTITNSNIGPFSGTSGTVPFQPPSLRALQQNMPTAYANQYSLTVEHEIAPGDLFSVYYSGSHGVHQYAIAGVNNAGYGRLIGNSATSYGGLAAGQDRLNPQYGGINIREANGTSHYDSLNAQLKVNNFSKLGLQGTVSYTYSHSLDNLSSTFSESGNNFNLGYLNAFNPRQDYGNSDYDTRHRVAIGAVYEPTFLEFKGNKILHTAIGGLSFDPIATVRTGTPFTIYDCTNAQSTCPRIVNSQGLQFHGNVGAVTGVNTFNYLNIPTASANTYVNVDGISDIPSTFGGAQNPGLGRNQWFGPSNVQFDLGVHKDFKFFQDKYVLQVRGEFYDILNHHNYYVIAGTADYAEVGNVNVEKGSSNDSLSASDERRNVQLAVRLQF